MERNHYLVPRREAPPARKGVITVRKGRAPVASSLTAALLPSQQPTLHYFDHDLDHLRIGIDSTCVITTCISVAVGRIL